MVRDNNYESILPRQKGGYGANTLDMRTGLEGGKMYALVRWLQEKKIVKASIMECSVSIRRKSIIKEDRCSKEERTGDTTRQGNDEGNNHQASTGWTISHLPGVPLLNLDGSCPNGVGDVAQRFGGVHNRGRGLVEHGGIWGACRIEQVELVTVGWILEYLIHLVELGLIVVLDEVGHGFTNVLNLLIPVSERGERDGVDSLVDDVGAVVPV